MIFHRIKPASGSASRGVSDIGIGFGFSNDILRLGLSHGMGCSCNVSRYFPIVVVRRSGLRWTGVSAVQALVKFSCEGCEWRSLLPQVRHPEIATELAHGGSI